MAGMAGKLERRARHAMVVVAAVSVLGLAAFEFGWIAAAPSYRHDAWYLVGGTAAIVITSEYPDEAACRREASGAAVCRPGSALIREALAQQGQRS